MHRIPARILTSLVLAAAAALVAAQPIQYGPGSSFATHDIAPGVIAFIPAYTRGGIVSGNSVAVIGNDSVLVVDTGHFPSQAQAMIARIRQATDKPVRWVVNTHWHPDHFTGNAAYRDAYPGVTFVASSATVRRFEDGWKFNDTSAFANVIATWQQRLRDGKGADGTALSGPMREFYTSELPEVENAAREWKDVPHVAPTMRVDDRMEFDLGGRKVQVMFLGRGNTEGDLVAWVADTRTLVTGDLLVAPLPYCYGSFISEWAATLRKLDAFDSRAIVPGHGPVYADKRYLRSVIALLDTMQAQASAAVAKGVPLEQFQRDADLSRFEQEMTRGDFFQERIWKDSVVANGLKRAWREAKEGPLHDED